MTWDRASRRFRPGVTACFRTRSSRPTRSTDSAWRSSIGPASFQVGEEVVQFFKEQGFPLEDIWYFKPGRSGVSMADGHHLDLFKANHLLWILLGWWEIALTHLVFGLVFCATIVGIPWGLQHFKMAIGCIFPFGKEIR